MSALDVPGTTRLQDLVAGTGRPAAPGPLDALRVARNLFLAGERVELSAVARVLGVDRTTLHRWVGSRDLLLGEVISGMVRSAAARARDETRGTGIERVVGFNERYLRAAGGFAPLRRLLDRDPGFALRVLTSPQGGVQRASVAEALRMCEELGAAGVLRDDVDLDDLAYLMVRIGEAFLYSDVVTGAEPDLSRAVRLIRMLLVGASTG